MMKTFLSGLSIRKDHRCQRCRIDAVRYTQCELFPSEALVEASEQCLLGARGQLLELNWFSRQTLSFGEHKHPHPPNCLSIHIFWLDTHFWYRCQVKAPSTPTSAHHFFRRSTWKDFNSWKEVSTTCEYNFILIFSRGKQPLEYYQKLFDVINGWVI